MIELVAIDPGLSKTGVAAWTGKNETDLTLAFHVSPPNRAAWTLKSRFISDRIRSLVGPGPRNLVIEMPEYQSGRMESEAATRSGSIMHLAALVGAIIYGLDPCRVECISPADWKGQVPKKLAHRWLKEYMTENNIPFLGQWSRLAPDTKDALSIGLWYLGR